MKVNPLMLGIMAIAVWSEAQIRFVALAPFGSMRLPCGLLAGWHAAPRPFGWSAMASCEACHEPRQPRAQRRVFARIHRGMRYREPSPEPRREWEMQQTPSRRHCEGHEKTRRSHIWIVCDMFWNNSGAPADQGRRQSNIELGWAAHYPDPCSIHSNSYSWHADQPRILSCN
ncbi:hypothetical protein B0J12DRAFT_96618 [Macrophomina phaseolina]|uniref:Secreted protein n=1 Tax=Macrophomina phaseolina TaxID=35725 RepID=A0ABQ8G9D2_9PEZI|nr:hypothetical protein B0J12DRAFT_96618 [Macrophomina phaseolina]